MKRIMNLLAAVIFLTVPVGLTFAADAPAKDMVKGEVVSVDTARNLVVVKQKDGSSVTLTVDTKEIGSFRVGNYVKAKVAAGTTAAESIQKLSGVEKKQARRSIKKARTEK